MKIKLSCDDACVSDIKAYQLAKKYNLPIIFYWSSNWQAVAYAKDFDPLNYYQALEIADECEIGSHGVAHLKLTRIPLQDAEIEILSSKMMLESLFNKKIESFCPPRGYTNPDLTEYTLKHYKHQRLTVGWDGDYKLVHVHPKSGVNDKRDWKEYAKDYDAVHLWFHSWELDQYDLWKELEEYLHDSLS